jgi:hypothetical protein
VRADQLSGQRTLTHSLRRQHVSCRVSCLRNAAWRFGGSDVHDQAAGNLRDLFRVLPHGPRGARPRTHAALLAHHPRAPRAIANSGAHAARAAAPRDRARRRALNSQAVIDRVAL